MLLLEAGTRVPAPVYYEHGTRLCYLSIEKGKAKKCYIPYYFFIDETLVYHKACLAVMVPPCIKDLLDSTY